MKYIYRLFFYTPEVDGASNQEKLRRETPWQILAYLSALVLIPLSAYYKWNWPIVILLLLFLVYDWRFVLSRNAFSGRSKQVILGDLRAACGYISYFLPLAGLALVFSHQDVITVIVMTDKFILLYFAAGLVFASVATLFIPVNYSSVSGDYESQIPSKGLKRCFIFILFLQKVSVTAFVCGILRAGVVIYNMPTTAAVPTVG